jgi:hypothetical protein
MRIGIDARILNGYVKHLLKGVLEIDKRNEYVLFFDSRIPKKKAEKFIQKNVKIKYFPFSRYRKFIRYAYSQFLVSAFLSKERLDVFHATCGTMPLIYRGRILLNLWRIEKKKKEQVLQKKILKRAERIIVSSERTKKRIEKIYNLNPKKIIVMGRNPNVKEIFKLYRQLSRDRKKSS